MGYLVGFIFSILRIVISGAFGKIAWNMCIPVIFSGAPKITIMQSIIIAMVLSIMTEDGTLIEDEDEEESFAKDSLKRTFRVLVYSILSLVILWLLMHIVY